MAPARHAVGADRTRAFITVNGTSIVNNIYLHQSSTAVRGIFCVGVVSSKTCVSYDNDDIGPHALFERLLAQH